MECRLIEEAKNKTLDPEKIKTSVDYTERLCESDKFDVSLCKCKDCGQVFIYCFKEYNTANWEDYYWSFWVPASEKDIEDIKKADILMKFMGELVAQRSHICWADDGKVYWKEGGLPVPLAYTIFLPI